MNKFLVVICVAALTGCASLPVPQVPKETKVAVVVVPPSSSQNSNCVTPDLPIDHLSQADKGNYPKIGDAYDQSTVILRGTLKSCMDELHGYETKSAQKPPQGL